MHSRSVWIIGPILGLAASVSGYIITALVFVSTEDNLIDNGLSESGLFETIGWIYYNAQFVDVELETSDSTESFNFVRGEEIYIGTRLRGRTEEIVVAAPDLLYHLIPITALFLGAIFLSRLASITHPLDGAVGSMTMVAGCSSFALVGSFIFQYGDASNIPAAPSLAIIGIIYPTIFATLGGFVGGMLNKRSPRQVARQSDGPTPPPRQVARQSDSPTSLYPVLIGVAISIILLILFIALVI